MLLGRAGRAGVHGSANDPHPRARPEPEGRPGLAVDRCGPHRRGRYETRGGSAHRDAARRSGLVHLTGPWVGVEAPSGPGGDEVSRQADGGPGTPRRTGGRQPGGSGGRLRPRAGREAVEKGNARGRADRTARSGATGRKARRIGGPDSTPAVSTVPSRGAGLAPAEPIRAREIAPAGRTSFRAAADPSSLPRIAAPLGATRHQFAERLGSRLRIQQAPRGKSRQAQAVRFQEVTMYFPNGPPTPTRQDPTPTYWPARSTKARASSSLRNLSSKLRSALTAQASKRGL